MITMLNNIFVADKVRTAILRAMQSNDSELKSEFNYDITFPDIACFSSKNSQFGVSEKKIQTFRVCT